MEQVSWSRVSVEIFKKISRLEKGWIQNMSSLFVSSPPFTAIFIRSPAFLAALTLVDFALTLASERSIYRYLSKGTSSLPSLACKPIKIKNQEGGEEKSSREK